MLSQSPGCSVRPLRLGRAPLVGRGLCSSLLVLLALGAVQAGAATISVPGANGCTLDDAIQTASLDAGPLGNTCDNDISGDFAIGTNTILITNNVVLSQSTQNQIENNGASIILDGQSLYSIDGQSLYRILYNNTATLTVKDVTLKNGLGDDNPINEGGGALVNKGGTVTVNNCVFLNNKSRSSGQPGGAIYNFGTMVVNSSTFTGNSSIYDASGQSTGGAIHNTQTLTVSNSTFENNSATEGGAISNSASGYLTLERNYFKSNSSTLSGGAVSSGGISFTANYNTFESNSSSGTDTVLGQGGGALFINGASGLNLLANTFSGNSASNVGGAINILNPSGTYTLQYNTISNNSSTNKGGGMYYINNVNRSLIFRANLISGNSSLFGKEFNRETSNGTFTFVKSYNVLGNSAETFAEGFVGYTTPVGTGDKITTSTLVDGSSNSGATSLNSIINTTLSYNGGPTKTHALVVNSPAIDTIPGGTPLPPCSSTSTKTQDQRGFYRANGNANDVTNTPYTGYPSGNTTPPQSGYGNTNCDMGAYEFAAKPTKKGAITYTSSRISGPTIIGTGPRYSIEYRIRSTNVSSGSLRNVVYKLNTVCFLNKSTNPYTCLSGTDGFLVDDGGTSHGPGWAVSIPDSTFTGNTFDNSEVFDTTIKLSISGKSGTLRYIVDFYADPAARETLAVSDHQPQFLESMTFDVDLDEPAAIPKRTLASQESTTSSEISHESSDDLVRAYK